MAVLPGKDGTVMIGKSIIALALRKYLRGGKAMFRNLTSAKLVILVLSGLALLLVLGQTAPSHAQASGGWTDDGNVVRLTDWWDIVGIGTTVPDPATKLHLVGDFRMDSQNGILLDPVNRPMITRGFDRFTSGRYTGLGRWGLFMEHSTLALGIANLSGRAFKFRAFNEDETALDLMTIRNDGAIGALGPIHVTDVYLRPRVSLYAASHPQLPPEDRYGLITTYGPNNRLNNLVTMSPDNKNHGAMGVCDANGAPKAAMYVNKDGRGVITAHIKAFTEPHPDKPGMEIMYSAIEGPEAAAYIRGTGQLVNGRAVIGLPEHFTVIADEETMTVQLTPHSAASRGLAIVKKSIEGIVVRELLKGTGNYKFDYLIMAGRRGYEDFQPLRPKAEVFRLHPDSSLDFATTALPSNHTDNDY
jgi:hypothetical protein